MRRTRCGPGASLRRTLRDGLVAAVAVLRIVVVVGRIGLVAVIVVPLSRIDVDVIDEAAIISLAPEREVDARLAVITVCIGPVAAAVGDSADGEPAIRARLDPADAEHPCV